MPVVPKAVTIERRGSCGIAMRPRSPRMVIQSSGPGHKGDSNCMDHSPDRPAESKSKGWHPQHWVNLVPYGLGQQHPNAYFDMAQAAWQNRDRLGYAWRILRDGC